MLKKGILIAVFIFGILSGIALAEERQQCAQQTIPEGYTCIEGSEGYTLYNKANFNSIFSADPVEQDTGYLLVKYGSARRGVDFGYLNGTIVLESEKRLKVTGGKFIAPNSNLSNISSPLFYINLAELPAYNVEMGEGSLYRKNEYGVICKEECAMTAKNVIGPNSAACSSKVDVKGDAFIALKSKITEVRRTENYEESENYDEAHVTKISNLNSIDILPELNLSITAKAEKYTVFGKLKISAGDVELQNKPLLDLPDQTQYEPYYLITLKEGSISTEPETRFGVFAKNPMREAGDAGIPTGNAVIRNIVQPGIVRDLTDIVSIHIGAYPVIELERGNLVFVDSSSAYDSCSHMAAGNLMKWDNALFFPVRSCAYLNTAGGRIKIKPRSFTDNGEIYSLILNVNLASWANSLDISEFECYGQVPCKITAEKYGLANKQLIFTAEDILLSPPEGSLFDFGISFSAYVIAENGKGYEKISCNINTRECRIYRETDLNEAGSIWYSESQQIRPSARTSRIRSCTQDSDCSEAQKCIEKLCVAGSECKPVSGANSGGSGKLDVVITVEDMDVAANLLPEFSAGVSGTNQLLEKYAKLVAGVEEQGRFKGMLTMEPFDSNSRKINFWILGTEQIPILMGNVLNTRAASRSTRTACANADYSIILTQQNVGSFNSAGASEMFISNLDMVRKGYGLVILHEFGHSFGRLADEYTVSVGRFNQGPNCVAKASAQSEWAALVGSSTASNILHENNNGPWTGCGAYCGNQCDLYVRPSYNSIMGDTEIRYMDAEHTEPIKYNSVSEKVLRNKLAQYA